MTLHMSFFYVLTGIGVGGTDGQPTKLIWCGDDWWLNGKICHLLKLKNLPMTYAHRFYGRTKNTNRLILG